MGSEAPPPSGHSIQDFQTGYTSEHRLRGFRSACGFATATWGTRCPKCGAADLAEVELSTTGKIAAFSVQNVPSDEFLKDAPYAYVLVDLDDGARVTGWMPAVRSESQLAIGTPVRFVPGPRPGVQFERLTGGSTA